MNKIQQSGDSAEEPSCDFSFDARTNSIFVVRDMVKIRSGFFDFICRE